MADKNLTDLNLSTFHIKEEYSLPNTNVKEHEEIIKAETEVIGGSWIHQNVDINQLLQNKNENRNLENSAEQFLNANPDIKKEAFEDDSKIWESINNLSTNHQKDNENGVNHENKNAKINNKEEKLRFLHDNNGSSSTGTLKRTILVSQKKYKIAVALNCAKGEKQKSESNDYKATEKKYKGNESIAKDYKCNECSYSTVLKTSLLSHIKSCHTVEKAYKCNECSYSAVQKVSLLSHIKSRHTMEKAYKCNECSYASVLKGNLLRHIKSHHIMEKAYKCNVCSYAAVQKGNLVSHIKSRHTMEKAYKCNECSYSTIKKSNLLCHIKSRHTMDKPYKCNKCSYEAIQKLQLLGHIKSQHAMQKPMITFTL